MGNMWVIIWFHRNLCGVYYDTCENCELLKNENKKICSWWEKLKSKLNVVREELKTLKDAKGNMHCQYKSRLCSIKIHERYILGFFST